MSSEAVACTQVCTDSKLGGVPGVCSMMKYLHCTEFVVVGKGENVGHNNLCIIRDI